MILPLLIPGAFLLLLLLGVATLRPARSSLSLYELRRRKKTGDQAAAEALRREELVALLEALRQPVIALLLVGLSLLLVTALGWVYGAIAAAVVALLYARAADWPVVRSRVRKFYLPREAALLARLAKHTKPLSLLTGKAELIAREKAFGSREELFHRIMESEEILSSDEKKLLTHALVYSERRVADVMTGRDDIVSIEHNELLGPLVLSDLHKTGHSCFPVVARDLDHVVGMLDIRSLVTLEAKRSVTAAKAMFPHVFYIRGNQPLDQALAAFVRTRHHLLVVIDEDGVTLGLLSLRDALEALFGRPMADEFASDSDLHLVAKRHL